MSIDLYCYEKINEESIDLQKTIRGYLGESCTISDLGDSMARYLPRTDSDELLKYPQ